MWEFRQLVNKEWPPSASGIDTGADYTECLLTSGKSATGKPREGTNAGPGFLDPRTWAYHLSRIEKTRPEFFCELPSLKTIQTSSRC